MPAESLAGLQQLRLRPARRATKQPADRMTDGPSGQIDRAALERIIQRAAELQTGERDIGDALTPNEVLALGNEVGIPGRLPATGDAGGARPAPMPPRRAASSTGCSAGGGGRRSGWCGATPEEIEERLLRWIEENELLTVQRQQQGRMTWEPLRGMQVAFRRSAAVLGSGRRVFMLERAERVSATVTPLEPGYHAGGAHRGESKTARASLLGGGLVLLATGGLISAILASMTPFPLIAAVPTLFFLGMMAVAWRQYRPITERMHLGLERALDHLEREPKGTLQLPSARPSLIGLLADEVRKAIRP